MATIRLCDLCGKRLTPEDDAPMIHAVQRPPYDPDNRPTQPRIEPSTMTVVATVQIYNEHNHPLTDICNGCKLMVVNDGEPYTFHTNQVATLHPQVAHDRPAAVELFSPPPMRPSARMPATPPSHPPTPPATPEPITFVPSAPPSNAADF